MDLKKTHQFVGFLTVIVFLGTGVFMRVKFPDIYGENEAIRFLFRANHVYILFSGLLNMMAAISLSVPDAPVKKALHSIGSSLLLASSPLFLLAFIIEPLQASAMRPLTIISAFVCLGGVVLHTIATWTVAIAGQVELFQARSRPIALPAVLVAPRRKPEPLPVGRPPSGNETSALKRTRRSVRTTRGKKPG